MSTGSVNSFNASLSPSSNRWLKHQIKEIQGKSSCNSLISPEFFCLQKHHKKKEKIFCLKQIQENVYKIVQNSVF